MDKNLGGKGNKYILQRLAQCMVDADHDGFGGWLTEVLIKIHGAHMC